jgi:alpha-1,2-mannosyltransferase
MLVNGACAIWALLLLLHISALIGDGRFGTDFAQTIWYPARAILDGTDPYAHPGSDYPPFAYLPFLPLGAIPLAAAELIWVAALSVVAFGTLWVLKVCDPRCYAVWLFTPMVFSTVLVGNATVVVVFLVALCWRYRDRLVIAGLVLGVAIALKLIAAPLLVWMIASRRYRAALIAALVAPLLLLVSWAAIGLDGLSSYHQRLSDVAAASGLESQFLQGLLRQGGLSQAVAFDIGLVVGAGVLVIAGILARRGHDAPAFGVAWASALVLSPIVWIGYASGLVVPLAARVPKYDARWLLLLGWWVAWWYSPLHYGSAGLSVATLLLTAAIVYASCFGAPVRAGRNRMPATSPSAPAPASTT